MEDVKLRNRIIDYIVACVNDFADRHKLSYKAALKYLTQYGALDFLEEQYEVEHTLPFDEVLEDMAAICANNGGYAL